MSILNKLTWIDSGKLMTFILSAQVTSLPIHRFRSSANVNEIFRIPRQAVLLTVQETWLMFSIPVLALRVSLPSVCIQRRSNVAHISQRTVPSWIPRPPGCGSSILHASEADRGYGLEERMGCIEETDIIGLFPDLPPLLVCQ